MPNQTKATTPFSDASATSRLSQAGGENGVWVTNLSAGEFLLAKEAGLQMLEQVMGTTIFSLAGSSSSSAVSGELKFLTGAYRAAQTRAVERLQAEAAQLGADGVVGVQIRHNPWGKAADNLLEFSLIGTAVRTGNSAATDPARAKTAPFVCTVSGSDYFLLTQAGWRPVGLAVGNCAYFGLARTVGSGLNQNVSVFAASFERTEFTNALYNARHLAMTRMEADARRVNGDGIVGVSVRVRRNKGGDDGGGSMGMRVHYFASGTVIVRAALPPGEKNAPCAVLVL